MPTYCVLRGGLDSYPPPLAPVGKMWNKPNTGLMGGARMVGEGGSLHRYSHCPPQRTHTHRPANS